MRPHMLFLAAAVALVLPLAACSSPAPAEHLVLRLATDDPDSRPSSDQIRHLARELARRSHGTVTITPEWKAAGEVTHGWDQANARLVIDGDAELGLIPARAWDALGVDSLRPLSAPFLISSDAHAAAVADSGLRSRLLDGLTAAKVVGIDMFPEGLRHPFGYERAVLGPDDYAGGIIRTPHSVTVEAMFSALGATAVDDEPDPTTQLAAESSYALSPAGTATGNVSFSAKFNVLVINPSVKRKLTAEQWAWLKEAAASTRTWVETTFPDDAERAATFCSEGGHIVSASDDQLAALRTATASVTRHLADDPATAKMLDDIAALAPSDAPAEVTTCPESTTTTSLDLDGSYTVLVTEQMLADAHLSAKDLAGSIGTYRPTLSGGHYDLVQTTADGDFSSAGDYTISGDKLTCYWSHESGQYSTMTVVVEADGSLTFHDVVDGNPQFQPVDQAIFSRWTRRP